jgi:hypothetical protein
VALHRIVARLGIHREVETVVSIGPTMLAGIGLVAAASAPTSLAIAAARAAGLALAGFVRGDDFVAYTLAERFGLAAVAPECDDDGR